MCQLSYSEKVNQKEMKNTQGSRRYRKGTGIEICGGEKMLLVEEISSIALVSAERANSERK